MFTGLFLCLFPDHPQLYAAVPALCEDNLRKLWHFPVVHFCRDKIHCCYCISKQSSKYFRRACKQYSKSCCLAVISLHLYLVCTYVVCCINSLNCIFVLFNRSHSSRLTTILMLELSVRVLLHLMAVEQRERVVTTLSASALHQSPEDAN